MSRRYSLFVAILLVLALLALVVTAVASAHPGRHCHTRACPERVAMKQCSQKRVVPCIRRAALRHDVSMAMLMRKARCESSLNPFAVNGIHRGLFQFNYPGTWGTTPYASRNPWRAKWNALAAGWMHKVGRGGEWECR